MGSIKREDMLELTRRMTISRNCFSRIAGAYFDEEGYVDGTFNTHFQKLLPYEQERNINIAKAVPFAETNTELIQYTFDEKGDNKQGVYGFLNALLTSDFKNDALLESFYEMFGERYVKGAEYTVHFFLGTYDIPRKGTDHRSQWESEGVYKFLICAICPVYGNYEVGDTMAGFLFPAYENGAALMNKINVYNGKKQPELMEILGCK